MAWQLADCGASDGGFAIVPGSHKSNEPTPNEVRSLEDHLSLVEQPEMRAGDVLFFAETATHGTLPWTELNMSGALSFTNTPPEEHHVQWENTSLPNRATVIGSMN